MANLRPVVRASLVASLLLLATTTYAKSDKVDVCHIPPGNPDNAHLISVSESAVPAHVANHGDEVVPGDGRWAWANASSILS